MGRRKKPEWARDKQFNKLHPVCPYCGRKYGDGDIFNVKNYPADGSGAMFLRCEGCGEEAELVFEWERIK
jgi:hypothetical protein